MYIGNAMLLVPNLLPVQFFAPITKVPKQILPLITPISLVGVYSVNPATPTSMSSPSASSVASSARSATARAPRPGLVIGPMMETPCGVPDDNQGAIAR